MTTKTKQTLTDRIRHLEPCPDAMGWLAAQKSPAQAWRDCKRGDWMLWLLGSLVTSPPWSEDRKPLLACCLDCAETVKHLWPEASRKRIAAAVAVLRQWIDGKATVEQAKLARSDLAAAYTAAAYTAAAAAAYAAAAAADTAYTAAAAAAYAAAAADAAYAAAAHNKTLAQCADIVRLPQHFPKPPKVRRKTQRRRYG